MNKDKIRQDLDKMGLTLPNKKKKITLVATYGGVGELSDEEVQAILDQRLKPKLGDLSQSEVDLVFRMREARKRG